MEPYFRMRNYKGSDGMQQIQLYYSHKGEPLYLDTGVRTRKTAWNGKSVTSKCQEWEQDQETLNDLLRQAKKKIEGIILDYKHKYGIQPDIHHVREHFFREAKKIEQDKEVKQVFEDWIKWKKTKIKNTKTYITILKDLQDIYPKKPLYFRELDINWGKRIVKYWEDEGVQNSTINKRMNCLKIFLRSCYRDGVNEYDMFEKFRTELDNLGEQRIIIPTDNEFTRLVIGIDKEGKEITFDRRLSYIRALYVISCTTGLRFSDTIRISPVNIKEEEDGKVIEINTEKTEEQLRIPISEVADYFLKQYDYRMKPLSNQKANKALHDLFKVMGFDTMETFFEKRGTEVKRIEAPKHELMCFHSGRRFFISTAANNNIRVGDIMAWSGHKSIKVIQRYMKKGMNSQDSMKSMFKLPQPE